MILMDDVDKSRFDDLCINYGQPCRIGHDWKLTDVGTIEPDDQGLLLEYFYESAGFRNELEYI